MPMQELIEHIETGIVEVKGVAPHAFEQTQGILEKKRRADGRDQCNQTRTTLKRPIGDPLQSHGGQAADQHAGSDDQRQNKSRMQDRQMTGLLEPKENFDTDKRAENKDFTMSKVDKLQDTINHGVTQSDQSIHETKDETVQQHLGENFQRQFQYVSDLLEVLYANKYFPRWLLLAKA